MKELIQHQKRKKKTDLKIGRQKKTDNLNRHFPKEDTQMVKRHMKRSSTPLIIRQMQIKTTIRYHLTRVRMVIIQKTSVS